MSTEIQAERVPHHTGGTLRAASGRALPLERTEVSARVAGPVAEVELTQVFVNPLEETLEAVYLFPLAHEAAVHALSMRIGARVIDGVVEEREAARAAYAAARAEGRAASLLEEERPNLFSMQVAAIPPGERVRVTLRYQERLAFDDGEYAFVLPLATTDRFHGGQPISGASAGAGPATDEVPDAARIRSRGAAPGEARPLLGIEVSLRAGLDVEPPRSATHRVRVARFGPGSYTITLAEPDAAPDGDFVLRWRVAATERPRAITLLSRKGDAPGTFLLTLTPPVAPAEPRAAPREVVFLLDRSASMRGESLPQARRALRFLVENLGPADRVQVVAFDHDVTTLLPHGAQPARLAAPELDRRLASLGARGGTDLERALREAVRGGGDAKGGDRLVVLVSDAAVGNEGRLLRILPELLGSARLYTLGLGAAPNRYLLGRLAEVGGGASAVLLPREDLEPALGAFARRLRQGGPIVTGLRLDWEGAHVADVYPDPIPDLLDGKPIELVGRYTGSGRTRVVLTGTTAAGAPYRLEETIDLPRDSDAAPGLERLWARRRVDALLERLRRRPEEAASVRLEVLGLALPHGLTTPYTALVALDRSAHAGEPRGDARMRRVVVPAPAPDGAHGATPVELAAESIAASVGGADDVAEARSHSGGSSMRARFDEPTGAGAPAPVSCAPPPPVASAPESAPGCAPPAPRSRGFYNFMSRAASSVAGAVSGRAAPAGPSAPEPDGGALDFIDDEATSPGTSAAEERAVAAPIARDALDGAAPGRPRDAAPAPVAAEPYTDEVLAWAKRARIGELDLVFLIDATGSMGSYIAEVQRHLLYLIGAIEASPLCRSLRIGLVSYRDHPPQDSSFVVRTAPLTADVPAIRAAVAKLRADGGGGDGPEAVTDGLAALLELDWRPNAARTVVWMGDAPPHGVCPTGDGFPSGCPCGRHWYTQAESCREMGITVHAVACLPALAGYVGGEACYRAVAQAARGLYIPLSRAALLVPLVTGMAESDLDRQRLEALVAAELEKHAPELAHLDEAERVQRITRVMQAQGTSTRVLDVHDPASAALKFRGVTASDIADSLDALRRKGRTEL